MTANSNSKDLNHQLLNDAVRIARQAGKLLKDSMSSAFSVEYKGELDLVTEMDRRAQDIIEMEIRSQYPHHGILAEEELDEKGTDGHTWIVDPLDGTTNYAHGFPVFSVSIGIVYNGEPVCGVVFNPVADETFKAIKGEGAFMNAFPIKVSSTPLLDQSLLGTGFPYNIRESVHNNLDHFGNLALSTQGIRRCGSAALDLCFVAAGRLDGFWELNLKPWDIAAGALIVREAGGITTDFSGSELGLDGSRVLASNGIIHEEMIQILSRPPGKGQD
jgi:myo-inositol-1(or 4)-monophosphatase